MDITKLLSKQTYNRIEKQLIACKASTPRGEETQYELLRELLAEFFTLKKVLLFPNKVLMDLSEAIQDLHIEQNNLDEYIHHTENYLRYQLQRYDDKTKKLIHDMNWERGRKGESYLDTYEKLDLVYLAKSYQEGYHKQQALMYKLLLDIIDEIHRRTTHGRNNRDEEQIEKFWNRHKS